MNTSILTTVFLLFTTSLLASQHNIGPGLMHEHINDFPWEKLGAGDTIYIHYRSSPYKAKWVINAAGTSTQPILIKGISGPGGQIPVIDGDLATTRQELNYWNEDRSVIKIGGSSAPADGTPSYITIENLEIRSGYLDYSFTDDRGSQGTYTNNASSIFVEKGNHITIRSCILTNSGNGLFIAHESEDILVEANYIYGNGVVGSFYEHNVYTEATRITYQYNRFGSLRNGADGNNLKDRSAGTVIRYNYIQGGNRLMDLVDSEQLNSLSTYQKTFVYGNILVEEDDGLNSQVIHYGGDSGQENLYRKGTLYFYHNTLFSLRTGNTTLLRLSTQYEYADVRNNILIVQQNGDKLALLAEKGEITIKNNLIKPGWVSSHDGVFTGQINDDGSSIESNSPGFVDSTNLQLQINSNSPAIGKAGNLEMAIRADHPVNKEYQYHQSFTLRGKTDDIGGYANQGVLPAVYRHVLSAEKMNMDINLTWETLQEINIRHFTLLYSGDGQSWKLLDQISPRNTRVPQSYQYLHKEPASGRNFYRLIEYSMDGSLKIINTVSLLMDESRRIFVYPLVTRGEVNIRVSEKDSTILNSMALYSSSGRIIQKIDPEIRQFSMGKFPEGVYYLRINMNGKSKTFRLIKL